MTDIDFDTSESDLQIGIEVEYPKMDPGDEWLVDRGQSTTELQRQINSLPRRLHADPVYDGTVGLEVVSEPIDVADAQHWYADVIDFIEDEYNRKYQPVGLMKGGSTAGTHIHFSQSNDGKARELRELSEEPWMQVLFCSSIANDEQRGDENTITWPVFRGGRYCRMEYASSSVGESHYAVVNKVEPGHYEWRLPEPMLPEHMGILARFLALFHEDTELAVEYAQELLDDGDDRITSIQRADKLGMDIDSVPTVRRQQYPDEPEQFYVAVADDWRLPEIYTVEYDNNVFYLFQSDLRGTFEVNGVSFDASDVLYADTLERVEDNHLVQEVRRAYEREQNDGRRETEATNELKKVLKKKKGKV